MELFRFGALYKGKNCQQDEMLLQDWCYFRNRSSLLTTFMYFTSRCCVKSWVNTKMSWMYKLFCLRMKITRIWLWYVLYIYTPFGILTSFPFRDGERGATKTEIRLMSGSCLMKLHSKHLMFHFRPTARPPLLLLGSFASLLCFGVAAYNEFGWRFISVHFGNKWASLVMHFDAKKCNGIHRLKAIAML